MPSKKWFSNIDAVQIIYKRWIPALGYLGAGVAAVGGIYKTKWLIFGGALLAASSAMASAVRQAEFRDKLVEAYEKLVEANEKLTRNSEELAGLVSEGEGFLYVIFPVNAVNIISIMPVGAYPLYDVSVGIVEPDLISADDIMKGRTQISIGTVIPPRGRMLQWKGFSGNQKDLIITIGARNGYWLQEIKYRLVNKEWTFATQVRKDIGNGEWVILHEQVHKDFPKEMLIFTAHR